MSQSAAKKHSNKIGPGWKNGYQRLTKVEPADNFTLIVTFESGEVRKLEVKPLIAKITDWSGAILDPEFFKQAGIDDGGNLEWPNEFGWHWNTVYEFSVPVKP